MLTTSARNLTYTRPYLYPKQEQALFNDKRWALVEASTKSGKTVGCIAWILEQAFAGESGQNFWWVAPVSSQAEIAFARVKQGLMPGTFTPHEHPTPRIKIINGTTIWFKSADKTDSLYGEDVYAAVIDEASRTKDDTWAAIRSTLTATRGPARIIGNVKGRKNWFYNFCRRVEKGDEPNGSFAKITVLDAIAAGVIPQEEVEDAKRNLPEHVFRELYMAEPSDDGGNPFGLSHIAACVGPLSNQRPVAFGIDLAKKSDWLVVIGLDANGRVCSFNRWRNTPWRESIRRIWDIIGEDTPALVDSTGLGDPVLEELQVGHGNFRGYLFSQISKQRLMEGLSVSIQGHEIQYPDGVIKSELESFEYVYTRTGFKYAAAEGLHDDCVCALALAREQWAESAPGANLTQYMIASAAEAKRNIPANDLRAETLELMPWRNAAANDQLTNELTELYESTLRSHFPAENLCRVCAEPVIGVRISDGQFIWHPQCKGLAVA